MKRKRRRAEASHQTVERLFEITAFFGARQTVKSTLYTSLWTAGAIGEEAKIQREVDEGIL